MKVQELAIIFVIIILPISIVISAYTQGQIKTINTQSVYDAKLTSATYDAIKAFQINTANDTGSDLANSKLNDIENSVKTFKSSIISSFGLNGYAEEEMDNYIPALVYTLYDGFYIYSPYENVNYQYDDENNPIDGNGENLFGLKPYISYSCRYKASTSKGDVDVVITYALDNYVSVQGTVNGGTENEKYINDSGYLIDGIEVEEEANGNYTINYKDIEIENENISEYLPVVAQDGKVPVSYPYVKINGTKYYRMGDKIVYFTNDGPKIQVTTTSDPEAFNQWAGLIDNNRMAKEYYYEAYQFTKRFKEEYGLGNLQFQHAYGEIIKEDGTVSTEQLWKNDTREVFDFNTTWQITNDFKDNIENQSSNFNEHRLAVIRNKIETNLAVAVTNFNEYSGTGSTNEFQMPELKEDEWSYITHNISLISFLQGLNIGGKKYNGYTIVTNSESKEVVLEESIYILGKKDGKQEYYRVEDKGFKDGTITIASDFGGQKSAGRLNLDFKRKKMISGTTSFYYYPLSCPLRNSSGKLISYFDASYSSIVMRDNVKTYEDIYEYIDDQDNRLKKAFYTALARERYGLYKTSIINIDEITKDIPFITITYDTQGGNTTPLTQYKLRGQEIELKCDTPARDGFNFVGWSTNQYGMVEGESWTNGKKYKEDRDLNLYAIWEQITYEVKYFANREGITNMPNPSVQKVVWGGTHTISNVTPGPKPAGYTFDGWSKNSSASSGYYGYKTGLRKQITNITDDVNLYAIWKPDTYKVTYKPGTAGGNAVAGSDWIDTSPTFGEKYYIQPNWYTPPTGYYFDNWKESNGGIWVAGDNSWTWNWTKNAVLTAQWKPRTYKVTYKPGTAGGSAVAGSDWVDTSPTYGEKYYIQPNWYTVPSGYEFDNWKESNGGTWVAGDNSWTWNWTKDAVLTAQWKKIKPDPKTYTFTIHGYGNTIHGGGESWPNAVGSNTESERKVLATIDLTNYTKLKLNINDFHSSEGIVNIQHGNDNISKARIYIGNTLVVNATTSSTSKTTWSSGDIDVSGYNGTYTIYYCYANMDGGCEAKDCTLTLE